MNFYNKYLLPRLLAFTMKREEMKRQRPDVINKAAGTVLEIGFGSGLNLPYYKNVKKLYALDPSQELFELARERIKKVQFGIEYLRVSAERIPLADNSVDSVVSTWSLCSITHPEIALKEIYRVLKSTGKFAFIEHGKSPKKFTAKVQKFLTPVWKNLAGGCHLDRDIDMLISNAGFNIQKIEKNQENPLFFMFKGVTVAKK